MTMTVTQIFIFQEFFHILLAADIEAENILIKIIIRIIFCSTEDLQAKNISSIANLSSCNFSVSNIDNGMLVIQC